MVGPSRYARRHPAAVATVAGWRHSARGPWGTSDGARSHAVVGQGTPGTRHRNGRTVSATSVGPLRTGWPRWLWGERGPACARAPPATAGHDPPGARLEGSLRFAAKPRAPGPAAGAVARAAPGPVAPGGARGARRPPHLLCSPESLRANGSGDRVPPRRAVGGKGHVGRLGPRTGRRWTSQAPRPVAGGARRLPAPYQGAGDPGTAARVPLAEHGPYPGVERVPAPASPRWIPGRQTAILRGPGVRPVGGVGPVTHRSGAAGRKEKGAYSRACVARPALACAGGPGTGPLGTGGAGALPVR